MLGLAACGTSGSYTLWSTLICGRCSGLHSFNTIRTSSCTQKDSIKFPESGPSSSFLFSKPVRALASSAIMFASELGSLSSATGNKQALISVSDKHGLDFIASGLQSLGYKIVSTGGTASALENDGISVTKVEELTGFPEMLDGRVKTLHPVVHGGILAKKDLKHHMEALSEHNIGTFDIVVVNLYPFYDTVTSANGVKFEEGIEKIDIGGPTIIRGAAKINFLPTSQFPCPSKAHFGMVKVLTKKLHFMLIRVLLRSTLEELLLLSNIMERRCHITTT